MTGRDWGFEVTVPSSVSCTLEGPDQGRRISGWEEMGIKRVSGRPFPDHERRGEGYLLMPAGRNGPAFIVTPNFYVLKDYNMSDLYALFVGHVGDRIQYATIIIVLGQQHPPMPPATSFTASTKLKMPTRFIATQKKAAFRLI